MLLIIIAIGSILRSMYFVSQLPDDNYQDPIVGMAFKLGLIFAVCGGTIYYFHNNYQYYDITYKVKETIQIYENSFESSKYVEEFDTMYTYYDVDGERVSIDKKDVKIMYEDCEPHIEICEVYKNYDVRSNFIFNLMIPLRFDDYTEMIDEEYYLFRVPNGSVKILNK